MTQNNHTPKPWVLTDEYNDNKYSVVRRGDLVSSEIQDLQCGNIADANLISAAPELLEALEALIDGFDGEEIRFTYQDICNGLEAIKKAKGK